MEHSKDPAYRLVRKYMLTGALAGALIGGYSCSSTFYEAAQSVPIENTYVRKAVAVSSATTAGVAGGAFLGLIGYICGGMAGGVVAINRRVLQQRKKQGLQDIVQNRTPKAL